MGKNIELDFPFCLVRVATSSYKTPSLAPLSETRLIAYAILEDRLRLTVADGAARSFSLGTGLPNGTRLFGANNMRVIDVLRLLSKAISQLFPPLGGILKNSPRLRVETRFRRQL